MAPRVFWAATWSVGVAIGIVLGAWLTVADGGAGSPGAGSLDIVQDVIVVPFIVGVSVFVLHLVGQVALTLVRSAEPYKADGEKN